MADRPVVLGHVSGLFGVKGWIKVYSYTRPAVNLLEYEDWLIGRQDAWRPFRVLDAREQGKTLVARIAGDDDTPLADRDAAAALVDLQIAVARDQLPAPEPGEYYWFDLIGLDVFNREGAALGRVKAMMETGANDVLVLQGERERLVPFVVGEVIDEVDLDAGRIVADWDADF